METRSSTNENAQKLGNVEVSGNEIRETAHQSLSLEVCAYNAAVSSVAHKNSWDHSPFSQSTRRPGSQGEAIEHFEVLRTLKVGFASYYTYTLINVHSVVT